MKSAAPPVPRRRVWLILGLLFLSRGLTAAAGTVISPGDRSGPPAVPFIPNEGQTDAEVAYYTSNGSGTVFVTRGGELVYVIRGAGPGYAVRESFAGGRKDSVTGLSRTDTVIHCYLGNDPSRWRQGVETFRSVSLGQVYEGIDIRVTAHQNTVEKLFTVRPGGAVSAVRGRFDQAYSLDVLGSGDLRVKTARGTLHFSPPLAFQVKDGKRESVKVSYTVRGKEYGFAVGRYDPALPLIIDPLLASTYLGGSRNETVYAAGVAGGDIVVAGTADSADFPGLDEEINVLGDAFIARLDPDLETVLTATYIGGSMTDGIRDMVVDGNVIYAAGYNNSPDFPTTTGAAWSGTSLSGSFVARFAADTLRLTAATTFHANIFGVAWSMPERTVYVAGSTGNTDFPVSMGSVPAFQATNRGGADSFIAAFDEDLTALKGATLLGGEGFDIAYTLTVDEGGYPVVAGVTNSAAFPLAGEPFDPTYNLSWEASHQWIDGFVARLTPDLSTLVASTYLGGGTNDTISVVKVSGSAIIAGGNTSSSDFPCASTFGPVDGNDAFLVMLDEDLGTIRSCAVFGGSRPGTGSPESVSDLAVHPSGSVFATGRTNANDFPTTQGAFLSRPSGSYFGAFVTAFARDLSSLEASSLIHGGSEDMKAIAFDLWGDVVLAGDSSEPGYPVTRQALQAEHRGGDDLVISRMTPDLTGPHIEVVPVSLDFGHLPLGMTAREETVIHNTGGAELSVDMVRLTPGSSQAFRIDNPCSAVPAFGSCTMEVVFGPLSKGMHTGQVVIHTSDHLREQVTVDLKGRAINAPEVKEPEGLGTAEPPFSSPRIEAGPNPCDFGKVEVGSGRSRTIRVINPGEGRLRLAQAVLKQGLAGVFAIAGDTCSGTVLPAAAEGADTPASCEVTVRFTPREAGRREAVLLLVPGSAGSADYPVSLTGTGVQPESTPYPGFWGWVAILILVLRVVLGFPVTSGGWRKWLGKKGSPARRWG